MRSTSRSNVARAIARGVYRHVGGCIEFGIVGVGSCFLWIGASYPKEEKGKDV